MTTATLDVCGDVLKVVWTGSVWQAPSCGAQFANCSDAMEVELREYLGACGETPTDEEVEGWLSQIER